MQPQMPSIPVSIAEYVLDPVPAQAGSLAAIVVEQARDLARQGVPLGPTLAAGFDMLVSAKYYDHVVPENWLWCQNAHLDIYPFLNACPVCALNNRFVHHEGNKPSSGTIGPATAEALREILVEYFQLGERHHLTVHQGTEPVDIAIIDSNVLQILVAEIKASPLFTPPLAIPHAVTGFASGEVMPLGHAKGTVRGMSNARPSLVIPDSDEGYWLWEIEQEGLGEVGWGERALAAAVSANPDNFRKYVACWQSLWNLYVSKDNSQPAFWLTGACGRPRNPGEGWPQNSAGRPKGSISDSKTSVGMDRTDDIKKSTFQVLNLGTKLRRELITPWSLRIGLMSNLHAGRHHEEYLKPYEDIMWGWEQEDGSAPSSLFRLFDGIISFSMSHTKDDWIKEVVDWH